MNYKSDIKSGVYIITNTLTGKKYIGSSKDIIKRLVRHKSDLKNNLHYNRELQRDYLEYGEEYFTFKTKYFVSDYRNLEAQMIIEEDNLYNAYKFKCRLKDNSPSGFKIVSEYDSIEFDNLKEVSDFFSLPLYVVKKFVDSDERLRDYKLIKV